MKIKNFALLALLLLFATACGNSSDTPTPSIATNSFRDLVENQGFTKLSFTAPTSGQELERTSITFDTQKSELTTATNIPEPQSITYKYQFISDNTFEVRKMDGTKLKDRFDLELENIYADVNISTITNNTVQLSITPGGYRGEGYYFFFNGFILNK